MNYFSSSICCQFDLDKNGHISSTELGEVMKSVGESIPGYKLREMISEVDRDKNGTIEFDEFVQVSVYYVSHVWFPLAWSGTVVRGQVEMKFISENRGEENLFANW